MPQLTLIRLLFVAAFMSLGLLGCADVSPTNPFDPTTPSAQQAKGSVRGRVELPRGNEVARLGAGSAELLDANNASAVFAQVALTADAPPAGDAADAGAAGGPSGAFLFEGVPAGRYRVRVSVPSFSVPSADADVGIGAQIDVGTLYATLVGNSVVEGVITLDPPRPEGAAGVTIEVVGTPLTTQTNSAGAYRLAVGAGTLDLRVTGPPGYVPDSIVGVRVDEGQSVTAPPLTLRGQPAQVRGLVRVETLDPALLSQVTLTLRSLDAPDAVFDPATPTALVDAPTRGSYGFGGLAPGAYAVEASLEGFVSAQTVVNLRLGDDVTAPELALTPNLQAGAFLEGVALLDPEPAEGSAGVLVELVDGFATAQTNSAGAYRLPVPPRAGLALRFTGPAGRSCSAVSSRSTC